MNFSYSNLLATLVEVQRNCCALCGKAMNRSRAAMRRRHRDCPTIDHVMPHKLGGHDGPGNIFAVHSSCNIRKGQRYPTEGEIAALQQINAALGWPTNLGRSAA